MLYHMDASQYELNSRYCQVCKLQHCIEDEDAGDLVAGVASPITMPCTVLTVSEAPHPRMTEEVLLVEVERH